MRIRRFNENDIVKKPKPTLDVDRGWINVKIDNNLIDRIGKYLKRLNIKPERRVGRSNLIKNIKDLINYGRREYKVNDSKNIYDKITYLIILQYFREINNNFDPSAAGLLMESLISCMLGVEGRRISGNDPVDIEVGPNKYQIKFYALTSAITFNEVHCDFTVICIKYNGMISIFCLNKKYMESIKNNGVYKINPKSLIESDQESVEIDFKDIDYTVNKLGDDIKGGITNIYDNLALLHDGIDSVLIGSNTKEDLKLINLVSKEIVEDVGKVSKSISEK